MSTIYGVLSAELQARLNGLMVRLDPLPDDDPIASEVRSVLDQLVGEIQEVSSAQAEAIVHSAMLMAELEDAKAKLEEDVVQRRRQARALHAAQRQAEEASRAKSRFLANMSHEIRTPLHGILSFTELGKEKLAEGKHEKVGRYLENVSVSAHRLLQLVTGVLEIAGYESGDVMIDWGTVEFRQLLAAIECEYEHEARERGIALSIACSGRVWMEGDAARLTQVVRRLLDNAMAFTPKGGAIAVKAHTDGELVVIEVLDTGVGIPEDEHETVFERFAQSSRTASGAGGRGLGLTLCRMVVDAHGGEIHVEDNPGAGTRLVATMPVRRVRD